MHRSGPTQPRCAAGSYSSTNLPEATSAPSSRTVAPTAVANGASVRGAGTSSKESSGRICRTRSWHERGPAPAALNVADASSLGTVTLPTCLIVRGYAVTGRSSCHPADHGRHGGKFGWQRERGQQGRAALGAPPFRAEAVGGIRATARRLVWLPEQPLAATVLTTMEHRAHAGDLLTARRVPLPARVTCAAVRVRDLGGVSCEMITCVTPPTQESPFLRACRREPVSYTPVWFMRQAGRSLPEYRAARDGMTMLAACTRAEVITELTLQPLRRFPVDAAILFSDIVVPLRAVGVD